MSTRRRGTVSVNSDVGEALGLHSFGNDAALMPLIDVANLACGFHSGDPATMDETVALAKQHGVGVGAHPGLPDLVGFGRREMKLSADEVESLIRYQVGALTGFLRKHGVALSHIKPHGSLYGMLAREPELMRAATRVARDYGVAVYGLAGSQHQLVAQSEGVEFVGELYVDLDYDAQGRLIILRQPHATDPTAAAERVRRAIETGTILADDGAVLPVDFGSVCVHSDTANAVEVASAVRAALVA
ncbi:5-oxoprolinase subunit PxpA [Microbacterium sp. BWT-B31]|uniref:5-oxoprolinase subunit PxpA n=1 Tax=Microbacterium sp. BWT-B31 TaxID=3232072 RepID=UPI0035299942